MKTFGQKRMRILQSLLIVAVSWTLAVQAELVIMSSGEVVKVRDFTVLGKDVRLSLPEGGSMTLPLIRIERSLAPEWPGTRGPL